MTCFFIRCFKNYRLKKKLKKTNKNIPKFSFDGIKTYAYVYSVFDADTITIIFEYRNEMIKYSCRLLGIDSPEIRTKDIEEKEKAIEARDFLRKLILNKVIKVELFKFEKYGRILANVYSKNKNINQLLIKKNYAVPYFGGTKIPFKKTI